MYALQAVSVKKLYLVHFRMAFICFGKGTLHRYKQQKVAQLIEHEHMPNLWWPASQRTNSPLLVCRYDDRQQVYPSRNHIQLHTAIGQCRLHNDPWVVAHIETEWQKLNASRPSGHQHRAPDGHPGE